MSKLKEMLIRHEGFKNKPYFCPAGKKTIGVGWNMEVNKLPKDIESYLNVNGSITDDMVYRLLDLSIEQSTNHCRNIYSGFNGFSENRRFALIDFMFNVGPGTALEFRKAHMAIVQQDWDKAADEMKDSAWYKQVGDRAKEVCSMIRNG